MLDGQAIASRNDLIASLQEAAEVEHGLLLQYLYATLTLKQSPEEHISPEQFVLLRQWKGTILSVAVDEMGHLGTVCNLLAAIGAPPRFERPEFPVPTGYYPFPFELIRFSEESLKRFVTAELPRGGKLEDCLRDDTLEPARALLATDVVPDVPEYKCVGELYEAISAGFRSLPEDELFIGSPTQQVDNDWSVNVRMRTVTNRTSALAAIDDIIRSGEGAPERRVGSHYGRFCQMWRTYRKAPFAAARPVVRNPRTRPLRGERCGEVVLINNPSALAAAELFNATYGTMLRLLVQFFSNAGETPEQREALRTSAARLMSVAIRPIAEVLTTLPARDSAQEHAGPSFELYLPLILPPEPNNRWTLLFESFDDLVSSAARLGADGGPALARLGSIADTLKIMERSLKAAARGLS